MTNDEHRRLLDNVEKTADKLDALVAATAAAQGIDPTIQPIIVRSSDTEILTANREYQSAWNALEAYQKALYGFMQLEL